MENYNEFHKYAVKHRGISSASLHSYASVYNDYISPTIIEERPMNVASMDVFSRLMMDRIIFLGTGINDYVANIVQAQLLFLESTDSKKDIQVYINSPGGSVYAGLGIYDTMQYINADVATICTGMAASMGFVLLGAGTKGKRSSLRFSRTMLHQSSGGFRGNIQDAEIDMKEWKKLNEILFELLGGYCNKTAEQVKNDAQRDFWLTAEEAKDYGLIDEVIVNK